MSTTPTIEKPVDHGGREAVDARPQEPPLMDLPDIWGHASFPASDPPANW